MCLPFLNRRSLFQVLSGCTVGSKNMTTIEAKVQSVYAYDHLLQSVLDPGKPTVNPSLLFHFFMDLSLYLYLFLSILDILYFGDYMLVAESGSLHLRYDHPVQDSTVQVLLQLRHRCRSQDSGPRTGTNSSRCLDGLRTMSMLVVLLFVVLNNFTITPDALHSGYIHDVI